MPQSLLTGQLKEKPTYRVWCLYGSFVHDNPSTKCIMKAWLYSVQSEQRDRTAGGRVPEQQAIRRREARQGGRRCRGGILQAGHCRLKGQSHEMSFIFFQ